ncbi:MAG TPA: hypothetical protein VFG50_12605 [Rhodothermales bacterium]|nr:hypothetical protein [Rhodothermales bacterium]
MPTRNTPTSKDRQRPSRRKRSGRERGTVSRYSHKVALLSCRFRLVDRTIFRGLARLFGDRIELEGWTWTGRFRRSIALARIAEMNYHPLDATGNLSLVIDEGTELNLVVEDAHRWRQAFEDWLRYHVLASAKFLQEKELVSAIAG